MIIVVYILRYSNFCRSIYIPLLSCTYVWLQTKKKSCLRLCPSLSHGEYLSLCLSLQTLRDMVSLSVSLPTSGGRHGRDKHVNFQSVLQTLLKDVASVLGVVCLWSNHLRVLGSDHWTRLPWLWYLKLEKRFRCLIVTCIENPFRLPPSLPLDIS